MHRRHVARLAAAGLLTVAAFAAGAPTSGIAQAQDPAIVQLTQTLDNILADARLNGAAPAVVVRDAATGEKLYDRNGNQRLIPASNTKLLTSAAAMEILGSGYRFSTDVKTAVAQRGPVITGDLYIKGTGDPTMLEADYDKLAQAVAAKGIRLVTGNLVADDTWFDNVRLGPEWGWDDESFYYAAQISALSVGPDTDYDAGNVIVSVGPGTAAGAKPVVTMTPANGYVTFDNRATTVAAGESDTLTFEREHGTNRIVITGQIPVGANPTVDWMSVWEPAGYAADVFRRALQRHGVHVLGGNKISVATPDGAATVASHESMTLEQLLVPFMKLSNNGHAEVLTKAIGRKVSGQGTWSAGLAAIKNFVGTAGMDTAGQRQADGSGLSRWNMIPAGEFTDLLLAIKGKPWFAAWYNSLPVAGNADRFTGGTLRSRMRNTAAANNVRAKTGSLTSVSALSGYVTDADGHELVFSILLNNYLASSVKNIEDRIAIALASFTRNPGVSARMAPPAVPEVAGPPADIECSWVKPIAC